MLTAALATVRTRWAAFAGTFAALALGVSVIAMMTLVLAAASAGSAHQRPERFAAAPFVIQVDPNLQVHDRNGSVDAVPLLAQPAVPASVIAQLPGVVSDRSFYAQVQGAPAGQPALGHGWSSAAFAPYVLASGHPPRADDEIVVAWPATVGSQVSVVTASGARDYTIAGTVRPRTGEQPVFFTDATAARLSPGVDALVTGEAVTARRAAALPGAHLQVLTGADRHEADPGAIQDATELSGLTTFLGIAALLSAFVSVTVTASAFGLSVAQRRRDLALLRTIGATPRQVMRTVVAEAAIVGAAGAAAGCLLAMAGAPLLAGWIVRQGLAPSWFQVSVTADAAAPLAIAFVAGVAVAVLSVLVAAVRAGTVRPTEALREAVVEPKRIGRLRLLGGLVAVCCGIAALVVVALAFPSAATDPKSVAEIVIVLIAGAALLSPFLLRALTWPLRRGTAGMLLRASILTGARRSAAVMVPVLITAGLTATILGANDTANAAASAAEHQQAAGASMVVLPAGTPGLTTALLDRIHRISGVEATAVTNAHLLAFEPQLTALHLESPIPLPFSALGIDQPSAALHLTVTAGSLASLDNQTVAVDASWHKRVGDTLSLWEPDGTPVSLKVVGVVAATLSGPSLIVDLHNAGAAMPDRVYVKADSAASRAAVLAAARSQHARVVPAAAWSAAVSDQQAEQNQVGLELLLGIAIAYSAIGIASTFGMSAGGRRSELALLHKTGAIRRQVVWFIAAESLVLTLIGIAAAAIVAGLVLSGLWAALAGEVGAVSLVLPWPLIGTILAGCVVIALLTSALPAWFQFRAGRR
ncbi:MAG TPA: FtsX-like permease family protein [Trebonia sp.]|nr:FtsX-like permease family protein [Trebonia sp.]